MQVLCGKLAFNWLANYLLAVMELERFSKC